MIDFNTLLDGLKELPFHYVPSITLNSRDVVNGYGWHRVPYVTIKKVGEMCIKCGFSTIRSDVIEKEHRHSWEHDEVLVFAGALESDMECFRLAKTIERIRKEANHET